MMAIKLAILAALDLALGSPNHDLLQQRTKVHVAWQHYGVSAPGRRLAGGPKATVQTCEQVHTRPMESMRIGYKFLEVEGVAKELREHIGKVILPRAVGYWMQALQVRRAVAPLRAERTGQGCAKAALRFGDTVFAAESSYTCESAEVPQCGADGIRIPEEYLRGTTVCQKHCPAAIESLAHLVHLGGLCDNCTKLPEGPGAVGYDFFAFVTIRDGPYCHGWTQAHATSCVRDQCDRPIFGLINFCMSKISLDPADTDRQVTTAVHELAHALGFSSHHFRYFRNSDGTPKLPREELDPGTIKGTVRWSCSGAEYTWNDPTGDLSYVDLSNSGLVDKFSERGFDTCPCPLGNTDMGPGCILPQEPALRVPSCVLKMTTPKVVEKVREFFGCEWLQGAELENQPTSDCVIVGSHWEERIFLGEVMTSAQVIDPTYLSPVTLALFEDSGWYLPDYSMADATVKGVHWGYKQGCAFATEKCVSEGSTQFPRFWCSSNGASTCGLDRQGEVQCTTKEVAGSIPSLVKYLSAPVLGDTAETDYCPYFHTKINNHVCTDAGSSTFPVSNVNLMREVFGEGSRCLESTLRGDVTTDDGWFQADPNRFATTQPGCFRVACSEDKASYDVLISDLAGSAIKLGTCTAALETLTKEGLDGEVLCANPDELCSFPARPKHLEATQALYADVDVDGLLPDAGLDAVPHQVGLRTGGLLLLAGGLVAAVALPRRMYGGRAAGGPESLCMHKAARLVQAPE